MKEKSLYVNHEGFQQAAVAAHKRYYSTPYRCDNPRQQEERAACLLEDGRVISNVPGNMPHLRNSDGSYDLNRLAQHFGSPVKKLVYRPNHDLLHTMRQAALVPEIKAFYDKHIPGKFAKMEPKHLERIQLMLLFAVSGRQDETGFSDSDHDKEKFYKPYRQASAKAFLEYAKQCPGLYEGPEGEAELYHDALLVEAMGISALTSDILKDEKNYEMLRLMNNPGTETNPKEKIPLPEANDINPTLDMLNMAHSLDLLRVYLPKTSANDNNIKNIDKHFNAAVTEIFKKKDLKEGEAKILIKEVIKDTIKLLQYSQKMLNASGEKHPTNVDLDESKIDMILASKELDLKIENLINKPTEYKNRTAITSFIGDKLFTTGNREYGPKRFDYCHYKGNSNRDVDRDFEKDVTSGMGMLNNIERPKISKAANANPQLNEILVKKQVVVDAANQLKNLAQLDTVDIEQRVVGFKPGESDEFKSLEAIQFVFDTPGQRDAFMKEIGIPPKTKGIWPGKTSNEEKPFLIVKVELIPNLLTQIKHNQEKAKDAEKLQILQKKQLEIATAHKLVKQSKVAGGVDIKERVVNHVTGEDDTYKPLKSLQFEFKDVNQKNAFKKEIGLLPNTQGVYDGKSVGNSLHGSKHILQIPPKLVTNLLTQLTKKQEIKARKYLENFKTENDKLLKELKEESIALAKKAKDYPEYQQIADYANKLHGIVSASSNSFYEKKDVDSFNQCMRKCEKAFDLTEKNAKNHRGWATTNSIVKGFVGVLAALTIIPALAVAIKSDSGFIKTFFDTPEETNTSKKVSNFKKRFMEQKTNVQAVVEDLHTIKPK